jgi:predicted amidohydrolase
MNTQDNILKIALIQYDIEWEATKKNINKIESILNNEPVDFHLIVLPEMFNSGFSMKPSHIAETMQDETVTWMREAASKYQTTIAGSVAIKENGQYFNRFLVVYPNGNIEQYDKRHLFRMSGEEKVYSEGQKQVIVNINGWQCALFVCYDLRFPVWTRNRKNYDLALYVANWPQSRIDVWKTLLKARALENQCYVTGVNRVGKSEEAEYNGQSLVYDYKGAIIGSLQEHKEGVIKVELSLNSLKKIRKKFPAWMDADNFSIMS